MSKDTYHVLLLYPDYVADYFGESYFSDPIDASSPYEAADIAKSACVEANMCGDDPVPNFEKEDLVVLLVVKGGEVC